MKVSHEIAIDLYIAGEVKTDGYNLCAIPSICFAKKIIEALAKD